MNRYQGGRSFVRPSGTEDVVRVYAEARIRSQADGQLSCDRFVTLLTLSSQNLLSVWRDWFMTRLVVILPSALKSFCDLKKEIECIFVRNVMDLFVDFDLENYKLSARCMWQDLSDAIYRILS